MKNTCISSIVENDLCIGCGVCAAICPDNVLAMQFNRFGEYTPIIVKDCKKGCGLCLKVCPFSDGNPDEDAIGELIFENMPDVHHRSETGFFLETHVGHSQVDGHREHGSSGGMATWLLETLLRDGSVDAVVCVTSNPDPEKLFQFALFSTAGEVRAASGSAYYPVELSGVLRYIIDHPGRYAVIGLPCFVKAIRLAQMRNRNLRERIVVVLGLVCGQLKSKHYTAYLAALAGLEGAPVKVHYRGKDPQQQATNFFFSCTGAGGREHRVYWTRGMSEAWVNQWFTPNACNYCDDIFAECADVTFMDAWLPAYSKNYRGTSLTIVRSEHVNDILRAGIENGSLDASGISVDEVIKSQAGVVTIKRMHLADRLFRAKEQGGRPLKKRVKSQPSRNPFVRWEAVMKEGMQRTSRQSFVAFTWNGVTDSTGVRQSMKIHLHRIHLLRKISAGAMLPIQGLQSMRRIIRGR